MEDLESGENVLYSFTEGERTRFLEKCRTLMCSVEHLIGFRDDDFTNLHGWVTSPQCPLILLYHQRGFPWTLGDFAGRKKEQGGCWVLDHWIQSWLRKAWIRKGWVKIMCTCHDEGDPIKCISKVLSSCLMWGFTFHSCKSLQSTAALQNY